MFLFLSHLWFFLFVAFSSKFLRFLNLHFLNLHFLLLNCPTRPCFNIFILAQCLYTCWTSADKLKKISMIYLQLIHDVLFISFMLNQILFQLLCKVFLYNFPPFLRLCIKILHLVFCPHQTFVHNPPTFSSHQLGLNSSSTHLQSSTMSITIANSFDTPYLPPLIFLVLPLLFVF